MNALRVKAVALALLGLCTAPLLAQTANFDDKPTGFLTVQTGGMPADSWAGTSLATAKRLVLALPAFGLVIFNLGDFSAISINQANAIHSTIAIATAVSSSGMTMKRRNWVIVSSNNSCVFAGSGHGST